MKRISLRKDCENRQEYIDNMKNSPQKDAINIIMELIKKLTKSD